MELLNFKRNRVFKILLAVVAILGCSAYLYAQTPSVTIDTNSVGSRASISVDKTQSFDVIAKGYYRTEGNEGSVSQWQTCGREVASGFRLERVGDHDSSWGRMSYEWPIPTNGYSPPANLSNATRTYNLKAPSASDGYDFELISTQIERPYEKVRGLCENEVDGFCEEYKWECVVDNDGSWQESSGSPDLVNELTVDVRRSVPVVSAQVTQPASGLFSSRTPNNIEVTWTSEDADSCQISEHIYGHSDAINTVSGLANSGSRQFSALNSMEYKVSCTNDAGTGTASAFAYSDSNDNPVITLTTNNALSTSSNQSDGAIPSIQVSTADLEDGDKINLQVQLTPGYKSCNTGWPKAMRPIDITDPDVTYDSAANKVVLDTKVLVRGSQRLIIDCEYPTSGFSTRSHMSAIDVLFAATARVGTPITGDIEVVYKLNAVGADEDLTTETKTFRAVPPSIVPQEKEVAFNDDNGVSDTLIGVSAGDTIEFILEEPTAVPDGLDYQGLYLNNETTRRDSVNPGRIAYELVPDDFVDELTTTQKIFSVLITPEVLASGQLLVQGNYNAGAGPNTAVNVQSSCSQEVDFELIRGNGNNIVLTGSLDQGESDSHSEPIPVGDSQRFRLVVEPVPGYVVNIGPDNLKDVQSGQPYTFAIDCSEDLPPVDGFNGLLIISPTPPTITVPGVTGDAIPEFRVIPDVGSGYNGQIDVTFSSSDLGTGSFTTNPSNLEFNCSAGNCGGAQNVEFILQNRMPRGKKILTAIGDDNNNTHSADVTINILNDAGGGIVEF
jgi:hypothetical protein